MAADLLDLPLPMSPLSPLGSRGFESRMELNLAAVGEVDQVTVDLTAGQPLTLQLLPQSAGMDDRQATIIEAWATLAMSVINFRIWHHDIQLTD